MKGDTTVPSSSRPPTPASHDPRDPVDFRFHLHGTPCESGESYHPGGYHPIELGDVLGDRYKIIRKLGYGSYSTVWLAIDSHKSAYTALKVMVAGVDEVKVEAELFLYQRLANSMKDRETASHFLGLEHHFDLMGPNGRHTCLAFRPMGPHLSQYLRGSPQFLQGSIMDGVYVFPKSTAKRVLREVLLGLQLLHQAGITHGDLHLGNTLVNIKADELDATPTSSLRQTAEEGDMLERLDGKQDLWAPSYLIPGRSLQEFTSIDLDPLTKIADLGAAFPTDKYCTKTATPAALRSPDSVLGLRVDSSLDVWSFGCLMYEILTGKHLFNVIPLDGDKYDEETNDEHLIQVPEVLSSRLPERFFQTWRRGAQYLDAEGARLKPAPSLANSREGSPAHSDFWLGTDDNTGSQSQENAKTDERLDGQNGHAREVEQDLRDQSDPDSEMGEDFDSWSETSDLPVPLAEPPAFRTLEARFKKEKPKDMDEDEENETVRLLHWILQIDPAQRPGVDEILQESWFHA